MIKMLPFDCFHLKLLLGFFLIGTFSCQRLVSSHQQHQQPAAHTIKQEEKDYLIRESYDQVTFNFVKYFKSDDTNVHRCKLKLQNCLFQTKWDQVFTPISSAIPHEKSKVTSYHHTQPRSKLGKRADTHHQQRNHSSIYNNYLYYYCQAFLIASYCIDDVKCSYVYPNVSKLATKSAMSNVIDYNYILNENAFNEIMQDFRRSITHNECNLFQRQFSSRAHGLLNAGQQLQKPSLLKSALYCFMVTMLSSFVLLFNS